MSTLESGLMFTGVEGAKSAPLRLHVTPASWDSRYDIEVSGYGGSASGWLQFTRAADGFDVVADAAKLPEGAYYATLRVFSLSPYFSSTVNVPVSVTVGPELVRPADVMRTIHSESVTADLSGTVPITLVDGPQQQWTAVSNAAWLTLTHASGQTGGTLGFSFDNSVFRALNNAHEHVASVTVTTANSSISPVTFDVHVTKRIAQVTGLGPYLHISGRPLHAYVRGAGFSAMSNLSRMQVAGLPNASFTLVNDTTLIVDVPGSVAAGAYAVSTTNNLGIAVASRTLKVVDPASYAYQSLPVNQVVGNVIYDAERRRVYVSSNPNGQGDAQPNLFLSYQYASGTWGSPGTHAVAAAFHMGLSNDGSQIFIAEPAPHNAFEPHSFLRVLDADTLAPAGQDYDYGGTFSAEVYMGRQLAVTNDGRVWLDPGSFAHRDMPVFDPADGTFSLFSFPGTSNFTGTWLNVPRDGSKLFVGEIRNDTYQSGVLNAATDEYTPLTFEGQMYKFDLNDDGSRASVGGGFIYDKNLQPLASPYDALRVALPNWLIAIGLMSPDGTRAYLLVYDTTDLFKLNNPADPPHSKPRIYVVNTRSDTPTPGTATILGYFEINDYPMCRTQSGCDYQTRGAISPDGGTLFFAGQDHLVVVPVPSESTLSINAAPPSMKLWAFDEATRKAAR